MAPRPVAGASEALARWARRAAGAPWHPWLRGQWLGPARRWPAGPGEPLGPHGIHGSAASGWGQRGAGPLGPASRWGPMASMAPRLVAGASEALARWARRAAGAPWHPWLRGLWLGPARRWPAGPGEPLGPH